MESAAEELLDKACIADADFGSGPASWGCMGRRASVWPPDVLAQGRNSRLVALGMERKASPLADVRPSHVGRGTLQRLS